MLYKWTQSQKNIYLWGSQKNYEWILRHMFRWIPLSKPVTKQCPKIIEFFCVCVFIVNVT